MKPIFREKALVSNHIHTQECTFTHPFPAHIIGRRPFEHSHDVFSLEWGIVGTFLCIRWNIPVAHFHGKPNKVHQLSIVDVDEHHRMLGKFLICSSLDIALYQKPGGEGKDDALRRVEWTIKQQSERNRVAFPVPGGSTEL